MELFRLKRRHGLAVFAAGATLALLPAALPQRAEAALIDSYCAPSGAYCTAIREGGEGRIKLKISSVGMRFRGFRLCVKAASGDRACKRFKMKRKGPLYVRAVGWQRHYPQGWHGVHYARWYAKGRMLGEPLRFKP